MEPQLATVDMYFLRFVLHDRSEKYTAKILRNLVSALKLGTLIAIMSVIFPAPNTDPKNLGGFVNEPVESCNVYLGGYSSYC